MADVVISYAVENEATVRQLAGALGHLGYSVWRPEGGSNAATADAVTDHIADAKAVVVIWSGAASASDWVRAEANIARGMKKLVQASADGNPPPVPFDAAQVSSISTWLGDDAHPGWDVIKAALARLAGPPAAPPPPPPEPVEPTVAPVAAPPPPPAPEIPPEPESLSDPEPSPAATAPATPAPPPVSAAPKKGPSGALIVIVLVVLVALLAAGAWFWRRSQPAPVTAEVNVTEPAPAPEAPPPPAQPAMEIPTTPSNETFDRQATLRTSGPAVIRSAPSAAGFTLGRIEPGETFSTYQQDGDWWRVRTAAGVTGYVMASAIGVRDPNAPAPAQTAQNAQSGQTGRTERRTEQRQPRPPRGPRIRKENSDVMAAFCDGAGRGTPQCRRFQRSY